MALVESPEDELIRKDMVRHLLEVLSRPQIEMIIAAFGLGDIEVEIDELALKRALARMRWYREQELAAEHYEIWLEKNWKRKALVSV